MLLDQHSRFTVVDQQEIPVPDRLEKLIPILRNPEIHRIAAHEANPAHLPVYITLERRLNIPQKQILPARVRGGKFRLEFRKYIQIGTQRGAIVHIRRIHTRPEEGFAGDVLKAFKVDTFACKQRTVFISEIFPNHRHNRGLYKVTCAERDVSTRAAKRTLSLSVRRFNRVVCDRTNNNQ